ncbi:unnamed protein product [Paramecium primaurelia]|uniref:Uncharacterized protein n=1 Tax=Paramecium primaurelia TaxID=5886 RepID=A0A8S1QKB7_PARPR|nr:unnamed protein product [Paramecium primaurelia]
MRNNFCLICKIQTELINRIDNKLIYLGFPIFQIQIEFIHLFKCLNYKLIQISPQSIIHQDQQINQKKIILGTPFFAIRWWYFFESNPQQIKQKSLEKCKMLKNECIIQNLYTLFSHKV